VTTDLSKTQLVTILCALDGERRNPANRDAALKAIGRSAVRLGLTTDEVLAAAPGLLDGRLDAATWRAEIAGDADRAQEPPPAADTAPDVAETAEAGPEAPATAEAPQGADDAEPAGERIARSLQVAFPDLPEGLVIEAQGARAVLVDERSKWVLAQALSDDGATHAKWRKLLATIAKKIAAGQPIAPGDPRVAGAEPEAVQPEAVEPEPAAAEPTPATETAAEAAAATTPAPAADSAPLAEAPAGVTAGARTPREGSKEARLIAMLRRPEGATVEEIARTFGWQHHTVRGAFAGALKRKRGLEVTSEKTADGRRTYRIT
jgi:hypothetical protein